MELSNNDITSISRTPANVVEGGERLQPVPQRPVGLTITVEKLDRALGDIQVRIEMLRQERINLELVRGELAGMEARWSGSSPGNTSLTQQTLDRISGNP